MRKLIAVGVCAGAMSIASLAHAQTHTAFGQHGEFIISADRLFPLFSYTHISQDAFVNAPNTTTVNFASQASISLLWGSGSGPNTALETFFTVPRVGVDYVIVPNVTLGGDVAIFFTLGGNNGNNMTNAAGNTTTTSNGNPSALIFGLAPRGGYILPLNDMFAFWLRGGVSYFIATTKASVGNGAAQTTTSTTTNQFALDLDPQFVFSPFQHFSFTGGLTADIPLTGGHSQDITQGNATGSNSASSSIFYFGVTAGILTYF